MKILIYWNDAAEAELVSLYLGVDENVAAVTTCRVDLLERAAAGDWDIALISTAADDAETAFRMFEELRTVLPQTPIVGACAADEVRQLARFIRAGMRNYVVRDAGGDFMFLLLATLENTFKAIAAEREQQVAERMREEIESVRRFQEAAISNDLFEPSGYAVAGRYESSQIRIVGGQTVALAGGDFYNTFPIDGNHMGIVVADAAGHGMRACMSITIMQTLLETLEPKRFRKASDFVGEINRRFSNQKFVGLDGSLITMLYGVLRLNRHELTWTTAGHPIPILHHRTEGSITEIATSDVAGPPLGVDADFRYESTTTRLPPGCRLLIYTDGLTEASPDENITRQFGVDGVKRTLNLGSDQTLNETAQQLMDDSHRFTQGVGRHDDTSALLLERL